MGRVSYALLGAIIIFALFTYPQSETKKVNSAIESLTKERDALQQQLNSKRCEVEFTMCTPVGESHVICKVGR